MEGLFWFSVGLIAYIYAGYPVHDRGGRMIGTFCVLAARPRPADALRLDLLQKYAAQAEVELHRLESEALGTVSA